MYVFQGLFLLYAVLSTASCAATPERSTSTAHYALLQNTRYNIRAVLPTRRTSLVTTTRVGLTFDDCEKTEDCVGGRQCFFVNNREELLLCAGEDNCICGPRDGLLESCTEEATCDPGELCASRGNQTFPFCYSAEYVREQGLTPVNSPPGDGFTRDLCSDSSDCRVDRICKQEGKPCEDRDPCICIPQDPTICCSNRDCIPEEVCAQNTDFGEEVTFCVSPLSVSRADNWQLNNCTEPTPTRSPNPTPNPSPAASPSPGPSTSIAPGPSGPIREPTFAPDQTPVICISTHLLNHLPDSELVFRGHPWGKVLCDSRTSCASPGHIVVYKGKPMMMSSYCKMVDCVERIMLVNSPRYHKKQRVPSLTDNLEFTVFSARYETNLEQHIMALAVKMGL